MSQAPHRRAHRGTLPLVVPPVVHHGARAWSAPTSVHAMVEGLAEHPALRRFVPNLDVLIDDLAAASNAELMGRPPWLPCGARCATC
ncbi:MAG: Rpn family recombination-promoting nuclease/putative transposase [Polyangiales bacterium]|nr:Rpn family recombination-promoting nuclease/putative transposase [Myxococcales bacterium]